MKTAKQQVECRSPFTDAELYDHPFMVLFHKYRTDPPATRPNLPSYPRGSFAYAWRYAMEDMPVEHADLQRKMYPTLSEEDLSRHDVKPWHLEVLSRRAARSVQRHEAKARLKAVAESLAKSAAALSVLPDVNIGARPAAGDTGDVDLDSRACGLLAAHADWSDTKIAKTLPCNRTSLYRLPRFRSAREMQKEAKRSNLPRGTWNKDRNEAEAEESDEER